MRRLTRTGLAAAVLALLVGTTGCSSQSSGSRHELFDSLEAIEAASTLIVVGEVTDQAMDDDVTVSTVVVEDSFLPAALATALDIAPSPPTDTVQVRTTRPASASSPILSAGAAYLLFLTPSMLPGDEADQFFVTGADAGIYAADGDAFVHGPFDGDVLPETLRREDLQ